MAGLKVEYGKQRHVAGLFAQSVAVWVRTVLNAYLPAGNAWPREEGGCGVSWLGRGRLDGQFGARTGMCLHHLPLPQSEGETYGKADDQAKSDHPTENEPIPTPTPRDPFLGFQAALESLQSAAWDAFLAALRRRTLRNSGNGCQGRHSKPPGGLGGNGWRINDILDDDG